MNRMELRVDEEIHLDGIRQSDKDAFVDSLNTREIYENTIRIPFPYTEKDASDWIRTCDDQFKTFGHPINWAIRDASGHLFGGIGFVDFAQNSHKVEIGYWLAKKYWNQGIMTKCAFGFQRISASVFSFNLRSGRVLEKAGFSSEVPFARAQ